MHESIVLNQENNKEVEESNYEYNEVAIGENFEEDEDELDFDIKDKEKSEPQRKLLGIQDDKPELLYASEFN
jgi:hypothetical protein